MKKLLIFSLALFIQPVFGHGGVERATLLKEAEIRLFVADNMNSDLVTIDLPSGEVVNRVSTPPSIMTLQVGGNNNHIYAMRGRDTDEGVMSIISTGYDKKEKKFRPPYVIRTLQVDTPGGGRNNGSGHVMATVNGHDAVLTEGDGKIIVLMNDEIDGFSKLRTKTYDLAAPDHYHYLEGEKHLYIGHLFKGFVQILKKSTGKEVKRIGNCPLLHGMGRDEESGRLFFSCRTEVVVVGTKGKERTEEITRIAYPDKGRSCAAFLNGKQRVRWCYTEGIIPQLYRLDAAADDYQFDRLAVESSIRQDVTKDGEYLLILSKDGHLTLRDGFDGSFIRKVKVSEPFDGVWNEDVSKAILPDIVSHNGIAYISLTHEGRVVEVDLKEGKVNRYVDIGGFPTRMVLLAKEDLQ